MGSMRNAVFPLILTNIVLFMLQLSLGEWFTSSFVLVSADVLTRPWIIITSMFLHASPNHLFFNMIVLYMFGPLVERRIGTKRFLYAYFISGIAAALAFALYSQSSALGASGAIMGILGLTIMLFPDLQVLFLFFIPMSMRTAGIIVAVIDFLGLLGIGPSGIANISHLAGLAFGIAYGYMLINRKRGLAGRARSAAAHGRGRRTHDGAIEMTDDDVNEYLRNFR